MCWWLNGVKTLHILYLNSHTLCLRSVPGGGGGLTVDSLMLFISLMSSGGSGVGMARGRRIWKQTAGPGVGLLLPLVRGEVFGWSPALPLICILFEFPACIILWLMENCSALPQLFCLSCLAHTARGGREKNLEREKICKSCDAKIQYKQRVIPGGRRRRNVQYTQCAIYIHWETETLTLIKCIISTDFT